MPECDLPHEGGRSQRARAAGGAASKLAGGHAPAQTCPSARTRQPSDGPDHHDEVAAEEERRYLPGVGVEESRALSSRHRRAPKCPTWPGSQLILLGCEVRDQGTQTSQAWCGLQGVLHRDLPGSAGGLASDGIAVRVTRPESHLCANAAPTVWERAVYLSRAPSLIEFCPITLRYSPSCGEYLKVLGRDCLVRATPQSMLTSGFVAMCADEP